jgi:hypothetical protein
MQVLEMRARKKDYFLNLRAARLLIESIPFHSIPGASVCAFESGGPFSRHSPLLCYFHVLPRALNCLPLCVVMLSGWWESESARAGKAITRQKITIN